MKNESQLGDVKITVEGLGGLINFEYYLIVQALRDAGCNVVEDNDYPYTDIEAKEYLDKVKKAYRNSSPSNRAIVSAKHFPWGG